MNVDEKGKGTKVIRAKLAQKEGKQRWSNIKITGILDVASPHGNRRYKDKIVGIFPEKINLHFHVAILYHVPGEMTM